MTQNPNQPKPGALAPLTQGAMKSIDFSQFALKFNLLGPRSMIVASEGMRLRAVEIRLSADPTDGDVYPAIGRQGQFSLGKNGLMKISSGKGIIWSANDCGAVSDAAPCNACVEKALQMNRQHAICPHNIGYRAVAAWLDPSGQWETHAATKYWNWDEELEEVRRTYRKQLRENRITQEQYDAKVTEEFNKRFRDRFSLAETKAKLRVIREIGVKSTYSPQDLQKGFLCVRVEPDLTGAETRQRGMASAAEVFGKSEAIDAEFQQVRPPDFAHASDLPDEPEQQEQPTTAAAPPAQAQPRVGEEVNRDLNAQQGDAQNRNEAFDQAHQPTEEQQDEEMVVCGWKGCGEILGQDVIGWCDSPKGKQLYDGQRFCRAHQREYEAQKKAQEGGGQ